MPQPVKHRNVIDDESAKLISYVALAVVKVSEGRDRGFEFGLPMLFQHAVDERVGVFVNDQSKRLLLSWWLPVKNFAIHPVHFFHVVSDFLRKFFADIRGHKVVLSFGGEKSLLLLGEEAAGREK